MKELKMDDQTYKLRRRVIDLLYEAREVIGRDLPRIKVRIVDFDEDMRTLGMCYLKKDFIVISKDLTSWDPSVLRRVVWHELGHAYFNARHDESCILMHPLTSMNKKYSKTDLTKALRKLARAGWVERTSSAL